MSSDYFVHESSYIDAPCSIGKGTKIWHFSHIMKNSTIGAGCNIGQNVVVSPDVTIGNNVKIQNNVSVYTGCVLEDDVFCGPSMVFTNVINPRSHVTRKDEYRTTVVRRGASLGANCTVVCGTTIGCYAFVGAGSVVTRDIPDYALVYGNPARVRGWMCACGIALDFPAGPSGAVHGVCAACGAAYEKFQDRVVVIVNR
jgi:UDP-2-acetamido-3-amino-2,3-dideoxy-glucuronate N-acetyltransferase